MYFVIYVSSATKEFSTIELISLLESCRENNSRLDITGMLLYKTGDFMQVLEGEENQVLELLGKIRNDPRHRTLIPLLNGHIETKQFPDWSMGFRNLNDISIRSIPGYNPIFNSAFTGKEFQANPSSCQKLLLSFKKNSKR